MALATFDLTDPLDTFARYSYLDDSDWLITGEFQSVYEISGGVVLPVHATCELRAVVPSRPQQRDRQRGQRFHPTLSLGIWIETAD